MKPHRDIFPGNPGRIAAASPAYELHHAPRAQLFRTLALGLLGLAAAVLPWHRSMGGRFHP